MKSLSSFLAGAAILAASSFAAHATPITANFSVTGSATYTYNNPNSATATFVAPDFFTTMPSDPSNASVISYFATGDPISFMTGPFNIGPVGTAIPLGSGVQIATATEKGETLTFFATDYTALAITSAGAIVTGDGYFTETCSGSCGAGNLNYTQTGATFSFSPTRVQGSSSFSANTVTAVTPEPNSLLLLGTGLMGAAGVVMRKRRIL